MLKTTLYLLLLLNALSQGDEQAQTHESLAPQGALLGMVDFEESRRRLGQEVHSQTATIELIHEVDGWAGDPQSAQSSVKRTSTDAAGAFRFSGLAPGFYTLKVYSAGADLPLIRRGIRIESEGLTRLQETLVFEPPLELPIRMMPAADPWHRPWLVRVVAETPRSRRVHVLAEAGTDETGLARLRNLEEGEARLEVRDADGRTWGERTVEVYREQPEIFFNLDVVPVEGRLSFGEESLAGDLSFGTTQGLIDIRMSSDEAGRFRGYLPREGRWTVEILWRGDESDVQRLRDVEVRRRPGKSYADLEIRIPHTELKGKVLSKGQPAKNVGITVGRDLPESGSKEPTNAREAILLTDAEGRFRLRGIEPGSLWVLANRGSETSGKVKLNLEANSESQEIVIHIEEKISATGLVTFGTLPVAGAKVAAFPTNNDPARSASYLESSTDASGQFELLVPAWVSRLDVLIVGPSLGVELFEMHKTDSGWTPALIGLSSERGTLRCRMAAQPGAKELPLAQMLRRNGGSFPWMPIVQILMATGQIEFERGQILFHDMAPGLWENCIVQAEGSSCEAGNLASNGELTLNPPQQSGEQRDHG